jgi:hypothetical protein
MLLFRFSTPRRIRKEMESFFCYRRSKISAGIRAMTDALYALLICYLDNPRMHHERMAYYAKRVYAKCGLVQSVWGLIDGSLRKTCWPSFSEIALQRSQTSSLNQVSVCCASRRAFCLHAWAYYRQPT